MYRPWGLFQTEVHAQVVDSYSETFISFYKHVARLLHMLTQLHWSHRTLLLLLLLLLFLHGQIYSECTLLIWVNSTGIHWCKVTFYSLRVLWEERSQSRLINPSIHQVVNCGHSSEKCQLAIISLSVNQLMACYSGSQLDCKPVRIQTPRRSVSCAGCLKKPSKVVKSC